MSVDGPWALDCGMGLTSCGLLLYRVTSAHRAARGELNEPDGNSERLELLIAHMGGPFWAHKDAGAWSIPKGIAEAHGCVDKAGAALGAAGALAVAEREFCEEMGSPPPPGVNIELGFSRSGKKRIVVFAREGDFDLATFESNEFEMEWPRGSGQMQRFPEVDRADWVAADRARKLLVKSQVVFVDRLLEALS